MKDNMGSSTKSNRYFLYVGNAYPHKNLERLAEAIILLNKSLDKPIKLRIVSSRNVFTERLNGMIKRVKGENLIELVGYVEDKELESLYKDSLAFVFPSLSEGFGLPGVEAMRMGTLVAASDIPVFKEIYKNNVIYFNPNKTESISNALKKILGLPVSERRKKIVNAKKFVKKYSWRRMALETLAIYEHLDSSTTQ